MLINKYSDDFGNMAEINAYDPAIDLMESSCPFFEDFMNYVDEEGFDVAYDTCPEDIIDTDDTCLEDALTISAYERVCEILAPQFIETFLYLEGSYIK